MQKMWAKLYLIIQLSVTHGIDTYESRNCSKVLSGNRLIRISPKLVNQ